MFGGGSSSPPPVAPSPAAPATMASANSAAAGQATTLAAQRGGVASTIFNSGGPQGLLTPAQTNRKTLLGS